MDFEKEVTNILSDELPLLDKTNALVDLLIPRIMYIPFAKIDLLKDSIQFFEAQLDHCKSGLFLLNILQSFLTYRQEKYQAALSLLDKLTNSKNEDLDTFLFASNAVVKGACFRSLGDKEAALTAFHFAIEQYDIVPNQAHQIYLYLLAHYHIAEINAELGNYEVMLDQHQKFLVSSQKTKNIDMINRSLNGMGRAYFGMEDYPNALRCLKVAEQKSMKAANIPFKAKNLHDIGNTYFKMKNHENSLQYLQKALAIRENNKLGDASISTYISIAKVYEAQGESKLAITTLNKALSISKGLTTKKKSCIIYELLASIYEKNNQPKEALAYYKKFHQTKEVLDDIKSTQRENERIRETNTQLYQQKNIITEQKKQIETYASKLTDSNKLLQNFAYIAAHDLKAPIKVTGAFIELIQKKNKDNWDDSDKEYFSFVTQNMFKLSKMIDNLLSLSRLDQDLPALEVVNTNELLKDIQNRLYKKIQDLKPEILIQKELPNVLGHESLIGQVFQNLIDNALKYRSEAIPKIEISCKIPDAPENKQFIQFEIKDNGQGIPATFHEKIFELFSGTNHKNSNGIGLATCKKIVSNYGGHIWVESEVGKGATMFFTLQAAAQN